MNSSCRWFSVSGKLPLKALSACVAVALLLCTSHAAEIIRGPYLQVGTPSSVTLRWRTDEPAGSVVFFGADPSFLYQLTGSLDPVTEHEVTLFGLTPATRYYYSVGSLFEQLAFGSDYTFTTSPPPGSRVPIRIWAIGDCGTTGLNRASRQELVRDAFYAFSQSRPADLWIALGDNAYYGGEDSEYQTQFFDVYPKMLRSAVLWPTLGNHETYSSDTDGGLPYFRNFTLPTQGEAGGIPSGTEHYYSFDYGNIHFISIDSEIAIWDTPGAMLDWLRADLSARTADWVIAYWHTPPYSKGSHDSDTEGNLIWMRSVVAPILESHDVDLVLCGHSHIYERSYLLHGHYGDSSTLVPEMKVDAGSGQPEDTGAYYKSARGPNAHVGAVYVVAGSSGWATFRNGFHPAMYFDELEAGSLVIDVQGDRLDLKFLRDTGAIDDAFTILKGEDPESLRVQKIQVSSDMITVLFRSLAGRRYQLQHTTTLESDSWEAIGLSVSATSATSRFALPTLKTKAPHFFRVIDLDEPQ